MSEPEARQRGDGLIESTNESNRFQARALKLLFICSRNRIRSLTAERILADIPGWLVRSAGTQPNARIVVTEGHVGWADIVFLMESSHLQRLREKFPEVTRHKPTVVLRIPDRFQFMQPELIDEIRSKVFAHVLRFERNSNS